MKSFEEIYAEILETSKKELEKTRKKFLLKPIFCVILAIVTFFLGIYFLDETQDLSQQMLVIMCETIFPWVFMALAVIFYLSPGKKYKELYKHQIIEKFIACYDSNLHYNYTKGIKKEIYDEGLFETYNIYNTDDLIEGKLKQYPVSIAEVLTKSAPEDEGYPITCFHGMVCVSELNCPFNGSIRVRLDQKLWKKVYENKKEKLEMDSSEFEEYFDVFAEDKIQAMQVLTSDVMEVILQFVQETKIKFDFTINRNRLLIRFQTGEIFEPNLRKSLVNTKMLKKAYDIINFSFEMIIALRKILEEIQL